MTARYWVMDVDPEQVDLFGPGGTFAIVDEVEGGIIAYASLAHAQMISDALNRR